MSNRTYRVGQILYVLMHKETKIFPIQIVEEIIKRTVSGESINYVATVGKSSKLVQLSEIEGDLFDDVEHLRDVLTQRVMNTVNNVVGSAITRADEWYSRSQIDIPPSKEVVKSDEEDRVLIKLPDGKMANVKMPNISG
jgi:hypothetical protein